MSSINPNKLVIPYPGPKDVDSSAFSACPSEVRLHIASFLPERDLRTLARVSRHFYHVATNDRLWKPIAASWDVTIPKGKSPYLHITSLQLELLNKKKPKISILLEKKLLWHNGKDILFLQTTDEQSDFNVCSYDLNIKSTYSLPPVKMTACHDDFLFVVYPKNISDKKGVHVYELSTGSFLSRFETHTDADAIQQLTVEKNRIVVIKKENEDTYAQLWTIEKKPNKHPRLASQFKAAIPINHSIYSVKILSESILCLKGSMNNQYCFYEKETQQLKLLETPLKVANPLESVGIEGYETVAARQLPPNNQFLIVLRSKNLKNKIRVISSTSSLDGTQEYSLEIPHFSKIFVKAVGSLVLIGSDRGTVYRINLSLSPHAKKAVKKLWEKSALHLHDYLYFVQNFAIANNYLVLNGYKVQHKLPGLPKTESDIRDFISMNAYKRFTTTIKFF